MKINQRQKSDPGFELFDAKGISVFSPDELKNFVETQILAFSFDKEMGDLGPPRDETREIDRYYKEREWRIVVLKLAELSGVATRESNTDAWFYKFDRADVNMVVVPNEEMRSEVLNYFLGLKTSTDTRLKKFSANPLPVISYDDLHRW